MGLILYSRNLKQIRLLPMSKPPAFLISLSSPERPGVEPWSPRLHGTGLFYMEVGPINGGRLRA